MAEIQTPMDLSPLGEIRLADKPGGIRPLILLVDDDRGLSALMKRYLAREGFEVVNLNSGGEVLDWVVDHRPDLMVIDYLMPDMNGKELVEALKAAGQDIPFITVTGQGDERLAVEMVKLGASDYLVKDQIMLDMLPSVVRNAINQLEQKRRLQEAERSRQESEMRYRGLFNASMEPIVILGLNGGVAEVNPRACELTGLTADELRQKRFGDLLAEGDAGFWNKLLWEVSEKNAFKGETLLVTRDGSQIDVEISASCLGSDVAAGHLLLFVRDIRERKWAEEEMKLTNEQLRISEQAISEREGRLRSIFQGSAIGIALLDMEGRAVECNEYLVELLGYEGGELRNMSFVELNHPEDRDHTQKLLTELIDGKRKRFQVEKRLCGKDGKPTWVRATASRVRSEQRNMDYIIKIIENINDRKLAEESLRTSEWKYRLLFDNMQNGFVYNRALYNEAGDVTDYLFVEANEAFETLLGIPGEEVIGKTASQLPPESCQSLLAWIDTYGKAALAGQNIRFEHHCQRTGRWFSVSVYSPQQDYFATIIEDITARHQLQDELQDYAGRIDRANAELESLLKGIARQLAAPVEALAEATAGQEKAGPPLAHMRQFLDDLDHYAALYQSAGPFAPADLSRLVLEALARREHDLHVLDAQIEVGQLPVVWGSASLLEMLFGHLIDNAIAFRGPDPLMLTVSAQPEGDFWHIAVCDNGIGLDPARHQQAFTIFQHDPESGVRPGSGMGLAICRRIVDHHGGKIWIESQENQGFALHLTLPAQRQKG